MSHTHEPQTATSGTTETTDPVFSSSAYLRGCAQAEKALRAFLTSTLAPDASEYQVGLDSWLRRRLSERYPGVLAEPVPAPVDMS